MLHDKSGTFMDVIRAVEGHLNSGLSIRVLSFQCLDGLSQLRQFGLLQYTHFYEYL